MVITVMCGRKNLKYLKIVAKTTIIDVPRNYRQIRQLNPNYCQFMIVNTSNLVGIFDVA